MNVLGMGRVNYFHPPYLFIQKSIILSKMGWFGTSKEFPGLGFWPKMPNGSGFDDPTHPYL